MSENISYVPEEVLEASSAYSKASEQIRDMNSMYDDKYVKVNYVPHKKMLEFSGSLFKREGDE